jgi:hypothetical protein
MSSSLNFESYFHKASLLADCSSSVGKVFACHSVHPGVVLPLPEKKSTNHLFLRKSSAQKDFQKETDSSLCAPCGN